MKSQYTSKVNLKKNNNNLNICDHITITVTNKASTKLNKISFVNYFLAFSNLTNQLADTNIVKKKHTSPDSFKIKTKLNFSNAKKFLIFLSTYILPNRQKFTKYSFDNNSNIISFHIDDWINLTPNVFRKVVNLHNQPSMQVVIVLNKKLSSEDAYTFLTSLNFPVSEIKRNF